jgi:hypothetical protein
MLTRKEVEKYCKGCYYYRGLPKHRKQCWYRVWEQKRVEAPSNVLRRTERCKHAKFVRV